MINIIHLHTVYRNYKTGIDRYIEMFMNGINVENYSHIKTHKIFLTNDKRILFPQINVNNDNTLTVILPLPQSEKLLFKDLFWKKKYIQVVSEILSPYLERMSNICFQYHSLFLSELAEEMKKKFGGTIITHLHCIPWKFYSNSNSSTYFNELYQLYLDKNYTIFHEREKSTINYDISNMIICLSRTAKEYLINIHGINPVKIKIIKNGLDIRIPEIKYERNEFPVEILYVGKISKDKGTYELLNTLKIVKKKGYVFKLKMAGTISKPERNKIRTSYDMLNIDILGEISFAELQKLYSTCTMGIIPSLHEQCSYVAIEMAMFGVPMIVSDIDALAEMFEHEQTALLTPLVFDADFGLNADQNKFADNIIRLIDDRKLRSELSRNVQQLYKEEFTLDRMITETVEVYKQLI
jgi:glycosyltransferase involved in cell wall biosynthesis